LAFGHPPGGFFFPSAFFTAAVQLPVIFTVSGLRPGGDFFLGFFAIWGSSAVSGMDGNT
jgi:hypothetical protein